MKKKYLCRSGRLAAVVGLLIGFSGMGQAVADDITVLTDQVAELQRQVEILKSQSVKTNSTVGDAAQVSTNEVTAANDGSMAGIIAPHSPAPTKPPNQEWGELTPGRGFLIGKSAKGELAISAYALVRYMNQIPGNETYTDHNGTEHDVDNREDIYSHRVLVWLKGWLFNPKFLYNIAFWTVNTTDQDAIFGNLGYQFCEQFNLYAGISGNTGSRSMNGSHPYWLGTDRVMADEFFRPFFTQGIFAQGALAPGLIYSTMVGNNNSILGTSASELDRNQTVSATMWWMPTTKEFGPRGGYGDYAMHEEVATRFGISACYSPEQRYNETGDPQNTSLKLADGLNVFSTDALAPGVTVQNVDYTVVSMDAGMKYMGFFLQAEYYLRWLNSFDTGGSGTLPMDEVFDNGFYIQGSMFAIPKRLELYLATSQIFGDSDSGFSNSSEYITGLNFYPIDTRDTRLNVQLMRVMDSPVGSTFGYYTTGQDGFTVSVAYSMFF